MLERGWTWLIHSDAGLAFRILVGTCIFIALAAQDLRKNGRAARRWREYLFLIAVTALATIYGAANDNLTSWISWEYFYFGKELAPVLGPQTPPDPAALRYEATKIGMKATWTAGLLIGVALLVANNPRRDRPPLPFKKLFEKLPGILITTVICSAFIGWIGHAGGLVWWSDDFREMWRGNEWRPREFMEVFGIHLGAYLGGAIGTGIACVRVGRRGRGGEFTSRE